MPRSCIVENCSNNVKSQPNLHFFILLSDKNRCWRLLQFTKASKILYSSLVDQLSARKWISAVCEKIQSIMYKILSQIYLTVSMGPSLMQSSVEFLKKFSFRWSPQFSAFDPPNNNPQNRYMSFQRSITLPLSSETALGNTWTQSLITNSLSFNPLQYIVATIEITTSKIWWSPQARFLIACSDFKL